MLTTLREIVLIDDDQSTNELHHHFLQSTEIFDRVHIFNHPSKAIQFTHELLKSNGSIPALYLIDILMPEIDGFELIDELNDLFDQYSIEIRPKFAMVSGSNHSRDLEKFERTQHTVGYVCKPLEWEKLAGLLDQLTH